MMGYLTAIRLFVRCWLPCCAAALLFTGCSKMVNFVGVSHYSYPVNLYFDESGPGQSILLASNVAPETLFGAGMRHIPEGGVYRFRVQNLQGKVVGRIVMPSKQFNAANNKDGWQLVLKPTPAKPHP